MKLYIDWNEGYIGTLEETLKKIDIFNHTKDIGTYLYYYHRNDKDFEGAFRRQKVQPDKYDSVWGYLTHNQKNMAVEHYINFTLNADYKTIELKD